jgi:hypothetical protein
MVKAVALHAMLVLKVADYPLDGGAGPDVAFDLRGEAALLL